AESDLEVVPRPVQIAHRTAVALEEELEVFDLLRRGAVDHEGGGLGALSIGELLRRLAQLARVLGIGRREILHDTDLVEVGAQARYQGRGGNVDALCRAPASQKGRGPSAP